MPLLLAGYIIDEIADFLTSEGYDQLEDQLVQHAHFELTSSQNFPASPHLISTENIGDEPEVDPLWSVAYNLISRGILTQCPFSCSVQILQNTLDSRFTTFETKGTIEIGVQPSQLQALGDPSLIFSRQSWQEARNKGAILPWRNLLLSPILIAQIQKSILYLATKGLIDVQASYWRILIIERDIPGSYLALRELEMTLSALFTLYGREAELPTIQLDVVALEEETAIGFCPMENLISLESCKPSDYDLILDIETFAYYAPPVFETHRNLPYFRLRPAGESFSDSPETKFSFKPALTYPNWKAENEEDTPVDNAAREGALGFLLRDLFRSVLPPSDISFSLSSVLASKDRLVWSNSPYKREMTEILAALLQPGISLWVCPSTLDYTRLVKWFRQGRLAEFASLKPPSKWEGEQYQSNYPWGEQSLVILSPNFFTRDFLAEYLPDYSFSYAFIEEAHQVSQWSPVFHLLYPSLAAKLRDCFPYIRICPSTGLANHSILRDIQTHFRVSVPTQLQDLWEGSERPHIQYKVVPVTFQRANMIGKGQKNGVSLVKFPMIKRILKNTSFELPGKQTSLFHRGGVSPKQVAKLPLGLIYLEESYSQPVGRPLKKYLESEQLEVSLFSNGQDRLLSENGAATEKSNSSGHRPFDVLISSSESNYPLKLLEARYSLHLQSPQSLEKFYLETDFSLPPEYSANSYIIYNPSDESAPASQPRQEDTITFKNDTKALREFNVLEELLNEVSYPEGFFAQYIEAKIQKMAGEDIQIQFLVDGNHKGRLDLYAYNKLPDSPSPELEKVGSIRFPELVGAVEVIEGINIQRVSSLLNATIAVLKRFHPINGYLNSFPQLKSLGIKNLLKNFEGGASIPLTLSYENDAMGQLTDLIKSEGNYQLNEEEIEKVYEEVDSFSQFTERLGKVGSGLYFSEAGLKIAKELFSKIRKKKDTFQLLYKLETLGLVDLIELEDDLGVCHVFLSAKEEAFIRSKFEKFLRSYIREEEEKKWLGIKEFENGHAGWERWARQLTRFFHGYIQSKKKKTHLHGPKAIKYGAEMEPDVIEEYIKYYFYALYALPDFLPATLQEESNPITIMKKYLGYLINAPKTIDLGSSWANLKHISSSCQLVKQGFPNFNVLLDALQNYADLALCYLEAEQALDKRDIEEKIDQLVFGVVQLQQAGQLEDAIDLFDKMEEVSKKLHPEFGSLINGARDIFLASCYSNWLSSFNHKFIDERTSN